MTRKVPGPQYLQGVNAFHKLLNPRDPGAKPLHDALTELAALGDSPGTPEKLPALARILAILLPVPESPSPDAGRSSPSASPTPAIPNINPKSISSKNCPNCLAPLPDAAKFCNKCGTKV